MKIEIFIDGSISDNVHRDNNNGAWHAIIRMNGKELERSGSERNTTINRMELAGITEILPNLLSRGAIHIEITSDSQYLLRGFTQGLKARKQRLKKGKLANGDLWKPIYDSMDVYRPRIKTIWVKSHTGHKENEYCDRMAFKAMKSAKL